MADSDSIKKKRELLEKKKQLLELQKSVMRERAAGPSRGEALRTGVAQGLTAGLSDELAAVGSGVKSALESESFSDVGESFGLGYQTSMADSQYRRNELREKFPNTAMGSELAGGLGFGVGSGLALLKAGAQKLPLIPRVLGIGSAEGALYGAGSAEPGSRAEGAALGGGLGLVGTPLALGIGTSATNVLRPVARRLGESLFGTPRDRAIKEIMKSLDMDDITKDEAFILMRGLGRNATLADVGDATARLGRVVTSERGAAASSAKRFLDFRQLQAQTNLRQIARKATGGSNFDKGVIDVINSAESRAAPIYQEVYSEVVDITPQMLDILERPAMVSARKRAANILRNEGFSSQIIDDVTDVRYLDAIKRALDDQIGVAGRKGEKNTVRVLTQMKNDFLSEIDSAVPRYAEARSIFAGEAQMREAADVGRSILDGKRSVSDIQEVIGSMGESELQAARYGFLDWLATNLDNQSVRSNTIANRFADVPKYRETIKALFPTQADVDKFLSAASAQATFARTRNTVTGGSPTARITADRETLSPGFIETVASSATDPAGALRSALRLIRGNTKITDDVLDEIGQILFNPKIVPKDLARGPARLFDIPRTNPVIAASGTGGLVGSQNESVFNNLRAMGLIGAEL